MKDADDSTLPYLSEVPPDAPTRHLVFFSTPTAKVPPVKKQESSAEQITVAVVDDDASIRSSMDNLLRSVGYSVRVYPSPQAFLSSPHLLAVNCLILDVRMPVTSGLELQVELSRAKFEIPIVFMTGHGDIPMSVRAMRAGAVDFLSKPFKDQEMLDAVAAAIKADLHRREVNEEKAKTLSRYDRLTPREREVMSLATAGMMNKQIAFELGLSEITVKIHRGKVMRKMAARTFADLVRFAEEVKNIRSSETP
ncbi:MULTISPECIES: response regulator transcription factor [unclassified Roseovarius]|uniref:response regulator transcription factor n=1 Tax=unclassified Roseovarius TaxID=2614913 RepID=UPI00273ED167|nr:response regulator [Roseovarius sp. MMSF_3350]